MPWFSGDMRRFMIGWIWVWGLWSVDRMQKDTRGILSGNSSFHKRLGSFAAASGAYHINMNTTASMNKKDYKRKA